MVSEIPDVTKILNDSMQDIKQSAYALVVDTDAMANEARLSPETRERYREAYLLFYEGYQIMRSLAELPPGRV